MPAHGSVDHIVIKLSARPYFDSWPWAIEWPSGGKLFSDSGSYEEALEDIARELRESIYATPA